MPITLEPLQIRRPFDPTGKSKDNYIHGEIHTLPPTNKRIIVPKFGAFYAKSLIITQGQKILVKGKDYELAGLYHDATVEVGQDVNIMIYFSNLDITGDITINYQVVGGDFTGVWETIQQYVNVLLVDPRKVKWDDILAKPEFYAPREHFHDVNDIYGLNALVGKLEEIRLAVQHIRTKGYRDIHQRIWMIRDEAKQMLENFNTRLTDIVGNSGSIVTEMATVRNRVNDILRRLTSIENDKSLTTVAANLQNQIRECERLIEGLSQDSATKAELNKKYDEMINKVKSYYDSENKLKAEHYKVNPDKDNLFTVNKDGVNVRFTKTGDSVGKFSSVTKLYVNSKTGSDTLDGTTEGKAFRTVAKALSVVKQGLSYKIYLKEDQTHILPPAFDNTLFDNYVEFVGSRQDKARTTILQLGNDDRSPAIDGSLQTGKCIRLRDSSIGFRDLHVVVKLPEVTTRLSDTRTAISSGNNESNTLDRHVEFFANTSLELPQTHDILWSTAKQGTNQLSLHSSIIENGLLTGKGRLFLRMDNRSIVTFESSSSNYENPILYTPSKNGLEVIKAFLPQLVCSGSALVSGISSNIDPASLPYAKGSQPVSNNKYNQIMETEKGLYLANVNPDYPKYKRRYYVDDQVGSDQTGKGTRVQPYKTIKRAMENQVAGQEILILLKEGQTHTIRIIDGREYYGIEVISSHVVFQPYGENVDKFMEWENETIDNEYLTRHFTPSNINYIRRLNTRIKFLTSSDHTNSYAFASLQPRYTQETIYYFNALNVIVEQGSPNSTRYAGLIRADSENQIEFHQCTFNTGNSQNCGIVHNLHSHQGYRQHVRIWGIDIPENEFITGDGRLLLGDVNNIYLYMDPDLNQYWTEDRYKKWMPEVKLSVLGWANNFESNMLPDPNRIAFNNQLTMVSKVAGNKLVMKPDGYYVSGNTPSDKSIKEKVLQLPYLIDRLLKVEGVSYKYQGDNQTHYGVIAQQLQEHFPELVHYDKENKIYTVDYESLSIVVMKTLQEYIMENDLRYENLLDRVNALEKRL